MNVILQHPKIEHYLFTKMPKPNTDNGYRAQPIMIKLWLFFFYSQSIELHTP